MVRTEYRVERSLNHKTSAIENLSFAFLIARRAEKIRQLESSKTERSESTKYFYRTKEFNRSICLTQRQHQCLWLYHQYKKIKFVAAHINISDRAVEEHLKLVRKKFQTTKLQGLMNAIDQRLINCIDKNNDALTMTGYARKIFHLKRNEKRDDVK